jgi:hypothetical protein
MCLGMPFYVARPHILADEFVPGHLGDSFGLLPFAHGNPLANEFHGPFLVGLIRKEIPHCSGFPFEIEGCDPHIPSCCHCGTMRRNSRRSIARHTIKTGLNTLEYQPAKLAAIEGRYDTVQPTPLTLVRYFDALSYDFFG